MRPRFDLERYADALLLALYNAVVSGRDERITRDEVKLYLPSPNENLSRICIQHLLAAEDIEFDDVLETVSTDNVWTEQTVRITYVFLTPSGFNKVSGWDDNKFSVVQNLAAGKAPQRQDSLGEGVPASDRTVTLNHNQPEYQEAVVALDKVIEEFRNDHRLDNELGPKKDGLFKILEGGRRLLDDKEITVEEGKRWLAEPLKWVLDKFTQGALQAAATKALDLICKLLGIGS